MTTLHPARVEQLRPLYCLPVAQEVFVLHDEHAIVPKLMLERLERLQPLVRPLLRTIRPAARPFGLSPWVSDFQETLALELDGLDDGVSMILLHYVSETGLNIPEREYGCNAYL